MRYKPESSPKTRRDLLNALWELYRESAFNIFREGPRYVVTVFHPDGRAFNCATGVRCIDSLTVADWRDLLNEKRWAISTQ